MALFRYKPWQRALGQSGGGTIKREAAKESLRRPYDNQIVAPLDLFNFAVENLPSMKFQFVTNEQYFSEEKLISDRFERAKTIAGTQKLHSFIPISNNSLKVSEYSKSKKFRQEKVVFAQHEAFNGQLAGYVTARYNDQWWLAYIMEAFPETQEVNVRFMHPAGPSASFYFLTPEDNCILHESDLILSVIPTTATSRTYKLSKKEIQLTNAKMTSK